MKPFFIWVSITLEVTINVPQKKLTKKICVVENDTVGSVIEKLGFHLDTIVVLKNEKPIPETSSINKNTELMILEITSKG
jgi:sulfur carrier protein ThiS